MQVGPIHFRDHPLHSCYLGFVYLLGQLSALRKGCLLYLSMQPAPSFLVIYPFLQLLHSLRAAPKLELGLSGSVPRGQCRTCHRGTLSKHLLGD